MSLVFNELRTNIMQSLPIGSSAIQSKSHGRNQQESINSNGDSYDATREDAIIYTIRVPPQCRLRAGQRQNLDEEQKQTSKECEKILSSEMKQAFIRDGVIAVRGLLSPDEISVLDQSSLDLMNITRDNSNAQKGTIGRDWSGPIRVEAGSGLSGGKQFYSSRHHAVFEDLGFRTVALKSLLPKVASELMVAESESGSASKSEALGIRSSTDSIRLLRDVFLAKDQE